MSKDEVTRILNAIEQGTSGAAEHLLPLVYEELRRLARQRMAQEAPGHTLQATALVHEAYLRLVDVKAAQHWNSRGHFFGAAAEAMRRILIDRARNKKRIKRGGERRRVDFDAIEIALNTPADYLLELDEALEELASDYPDCIELVKLRFFAGMSHGEAAEALGLARRTADRYWAYARAWLHQQLSRDDPSVQS
jgi:RNA polymerase sigma factor (TIGR02999 family)